MTSLGLASVSATRGGESRGYAERMTARNNPYLPCVRAKKKRKDLENGSEEEKTPHILTFAGVQWEESLPGTEV